MCTNHRGRAARCCDARVAHPLQFCVAVVTADMPKYLGRVKKKTSGWVGIAGGGFKPDPDGTVTTGAGFLYPYI